jgi:hypothetical protein
MILSTTNIKAQEGLNKSIVDSLYSRGLLTANGKEVMNNYFEQFSPSKNSELLMFLSEVYGKEYLTRTNLYEYMSQILTRERTDKSPLIKPDTNFDEIDVLPDEELRGKSFIPKGLFSPIMPGIGVEKSDLVPTSRSVMGRNLISTTTSLIDLGIVEKTIADEFLKKLSDEIPPEHLMLYYYSFGMGELEKRPDIVNELRIKFEEWKRHDLIEEDLEVDFTKVREPFSLLNYSSNALIFKVDDLSIDPFIAFSEIVSSISNLIRYDISLVKFDLIVDNDTNSQSKRIDADIKVYDGASYYSDTIYYTYAGGNTSIEDGLKTNFTSGIIKVMNRVLIAKNDCRRLYFLQPQRNENGSKVMGLMLLNKDQYSAIQEFKNSRQFLTGPHPENSLSECVTTQILDEAINIGLIDGEPSSENIKNARSLVSAILMESELRIPKTYRIENLTNTGFLKLFSKASNGAIRFEDVNVSNASKDQSQRIDFIFNGKKYEYALNTERIFDFNLYKYVSSLMNYEDTASQFYNLGYNQYDIGLMYLSPTQKNWIENNSTNIWIGKF